VQIQIESMRTHIIPFLFFCFITVSIHAQQYEFTRLDNTDGLSNNQVECIFKDSRGFIWIGTNMGLNRYDGVNFKIYKNQKNDPQTPSGDKFFGIQEDINGNLWIQSYTYLFYDWRNERFINNTDSILVAMGLPPAPAVIEIDRDKNFFVAIPDGGVYKREAQSGNISHYGQSESSNNLDLSDIIKIKAQDHFFWALHRNGILERVNTETGLVDFRNAFFKDNAQNAIIQKSIFIDSDKQVWIYPGIDDRGTAYLDIKQNRWTLLNTNTEPALSNNFVRCVGQDNTDRIWIGIDHGGINIFDKKQNAIEAIKNNTYNPNSISQNSIISLLCEDNGSVWAGTYKNGISYYHSNLFKFKKPPLFYRFSHNAEIFDCNRLYMDKSGNLWIGTNGQGLIKYNPQNDNIQRFRNDPNNPQSLSSDIVTSIFEDHERVLWVGTFLGGMSAFNGRQFVRYQRDENNSGSLANKSVYDIIEDEDNRLWIATLGGGIDCLNPGRNRFTHYHTENSPLQSNYILSATVDVHKNIYFGSDHGVYVINRNSQTVLPYFAETGFLDSLTTTATPYPLTDSRGLLWIATDKGINIYNPFTKQFSYIMASNGLPGDEVVSLIEDNDGNIWAGTRNGLVCIYCQYAEQKLEYSLTCFDTADGLPGSVFNTNAIFKDNKGIIYAGSTRGYVAFNPKEITFNRVIPQVRFTDLLIAGQTIQPNRTYNGRVVLNKSIVDLNEITLKYRETNFTIQFSALNFIHPGKNRYRYMLEGLDKQWTDITGGTGAASYSNLNPGAYNLVVYASNNDNTWSAVPAMLKITVEPPFWLSPWAYIIYCILLISFIRLFLKFKLNQQKEKYKQAQKMMEINKLHEVDELKFKFFTNISHEFKTPVSLILNPLEMLMKSPVYQEYKSTLDIMYKNTNSLYNMVSEILDFRKFDLNKMTLNRSRGDVIEFAKDICLSFSSLAAEKSIKLTFTTDLQELQMEFDREKMHRIITNLISNAFKYTEEGQIDVIVGVSEQMFLKISDTGIGIEAEYRDKIFERFFRIEQADKSIPSGTGIGLHLVSEYVKLHGGEISLESAVGKGSVFTVRIPLQNAVVKKLKNQEIIYPGNPGHFPSEEKAGKKQAQPSNLPLLLAIDDNEDFCEFITGLFIDDYRVVTAGDGDEGYRSVLDLVPDIIICDVMMPKMDGYEFCRKVKEDMRISHIPIILLTAKSSEESKYSGIEAGADDYISKPFNMDLLKLKIAKIIEKQKAFQNKFKKKIEITTGDVEIVSMDEKFVRKAVSIVEKNISNPDFLVEDLCKEMGMSRVYFYKKTLALTDKTPSQFIRFIRLKRAVDLLEKSQLFVNEIAWQVGFNEPKYFRKYFKEEFGVTPNEYKKNKC
jgi:signal transduction histidine kinase/ligand-binding sensor domain-containing protein/DNA-binding response OmpR family regulator